MPYDVDSAAFLQHQLPPISDYAAFSPLFPPHIADSAAFLLLLLPQIADPAPFLLLLLPHIADSVASYGGFESLFDANAALIMLPFAPPMPCTSSGHISPRGGARRSSRSAGINTASPC